MQPVLVALVALFSILAALNLLLTLALARRLADVERTTDGLRGEPRMPRVGAEVTAFSVETVAGVQWTDARLRSGRTLLVFSMPGCSPCATLAEELRHTQLPPGVGLLVLLAGIGQERAALAATEYPVMAEVAFVPPDSDVTDRFEVDAFPTVVLVEDGRITAVGRKPAEVLATLAAAPA